MERLRLITRADLPAGAQAAQLVHAAIGWAAEHPELAQRWRTTSNTLVLLAVRDEAALEHLLGRAQLAGIPAAAFHEPDLEGALTAIGLAPGPEARRLCRGFPLALAPARPPASPACSGSVAATPARRPGTPRSPAAGC